MKLIDMTCPHCAAHLKVDPEQKQAICEHCGASVIIDDEVQHVQYDNAEEAGYMFEKGRQRAQAEQRQQSAQLKNDYYEQKPKKKRTWLWVLGWICIFPLPLTILLLRKKEMKPGLKYGLIASAWIIYLIIGLFGRPGSSDKAANNQSQPSPTLAVTQAVSDKGSKESTASVDNSSLVEQANETVDEMILLQDFIEDYLENGEYDNIKDIASKHGLYTDYRKTGTGSAYYKVACSKELAKVISNSDIDVFGNYVVIEVSLLGRSVAWIRLHHDDSYDEIDVSPMNEDSNSSFYDEDAFISDLNFSIRGLLRPRDRIDEISINNKSLLIKMSLSRTDKTIEQFSGVFEKVLEVQKGYELWDSITVDFGSLGRITKTKADIVNDGSQHFVIDKSDIIK